MVRGRSSRSMHRRRSATRGDRCERGDGGHDLAGVEQERGRASGIELGCGVMRCAMRDAPCAYAVRDARCAVRGCAVRGARCAAARCAVRDARCAVRGCAAARLRGCAIARRGLRTAWLRLLPRAIWRPSTASRRASPQPVYPTRRSRVWSRSRGRGREGGVEQRHRHDLQTGASRRFERVHGRGVSLCTDPQGDVP